MKKYAGKWMTVALLFIFILSGCVGTGKNEDPGKSGAIGKANVAEVEEQVAEEDETEPLEEEETEEAEETIRVGTAELGYVEVPADWVPFEDLAGGTDFQYSSSDGKTIVTLNVFDLSTVPEEEKAGFDAEAAANNVWNNIEINGADSLNEVQGAKVELAGYEAYQVYAFYKDGTFLVTWSFTDENGVIRYVAAEGPAATIMETVDRIEQTYTIN